MSEATYTAWDDNAYPWPPPEAWYQAADGKWWPEGYGPQGGAATGGTASAADAVGESATTATSSDATESAGTYGSGGLGAGAAASASAQSTLAAGAAGVGNGAASVRRSGSDIFEGMQSDSLAAEAAATRPVGGIGSPAAAAEAAPTGSSYPTTEISDYTNSGASAFTERRSVDDYSADPSEFSSSVDNVVPESLTSDSDVASADYSSALDRAASEDHTIGLGRPLSNDYTAVQDYTSVNPSGDRQALGYTGDAGGETPIPGQALPAEFNDGYDSPDRLGDASNEPLSALAPDVAAPNGLPVPNSLTPNGLSVPDSLTANDLSVPDSLTPNGLSVPDSLTPNGLSADATEILPRRGVSNLGPTVDAPPVGDVGSDIPDALAGPTGNQVQWAEPESLAVRDSTTQQISKTPAPLARPAPSSDAGFESPAMADTFAPGPPQGSPMPEADFDDPFADFDNHGIAGASPDSGPLLAPATNVGKPKGRGRRVLFSLIGLLALGLAAVAGYFFYQQQQDGNTDREAAAVSEVDTADAVPGSLANPHEAARAVQIEYTVDEAPQVWTIQSSTAATTDLGSTTEIQVDVSVTNGNADGASDLNDLVLSIVGSDGAVVSSEFSDCANAQAMSWQQSVDAGATSTGPVCWVVPTDAVDGAVLGIESTKAQGRIYMRLPQ